MIDKKFVAIMLALGLIVLIVIAIGQDKYNQDIAAKLAAEGNSGIAANSPQETIANLGS
jgi:hypothetical protein